MGPIQSEILHCDAGICLEQLERLEGHCQVRVYLNMTTFHEAVAVMVPACFPSGGRWSSGGCFDNWFLLF